MPGGILDQARKRLPVEYTRAHSSQSLSPFDISNYTRRVITTPTYVDPETGKQIPVSSPGLLPVSTTMSGQEEVKTPAEKLREQDGGDGNKEGNDPFAPSNKGFGYGYVDPSKMAPPTLPGWATKLASAVNPLLGLGAKAYNSRVENKGTYVTPDGEIYTGKNPPTGSVYAGQTTGEEFKGGTVMDTGYGSYDANNDGYVGFGEGVSGAGYGGFGGDDNSTVSQGTTGGFDDWSWDDPVTSDENTVTSSSDNNDNDGGYSGSGSADAQDNYGGGWDDGYWNRGGYIQANKGADTSNFPGEPRGTDQVPVWAQEGEFVVDNDSTEKFGPIIKKINEWEPEDGGTEAEKILSEFNDWINAYSKGAK